MHLVLANPEATPSQVSLEIHNSVGIVFVGRSDRRKRSDVFMRIAKALEGGIFSVQSFVPDRIMVLEQVDARLARLSPTIASSAGVRHRLHRRILRFVIKGMMVLWVRPRWEFVTALFRPKPLTMARELDRFLEHAPFRRVHLITHSAGGIAATKISENPKVASICCFGYPFKHPRQAAESYRTKHLAQTAKPLLFIQGTADEYCPPSTDLATTLPAHAQVIAVDCDHDYSGICDAQFERVVIALRTLIDEPSCTRRSDAAASLHVQSIQAGRARHHS